VRSLVLQSLEQGFEPFVAQDLINAHDKLLGEFRKGDAQAALNAAGLFAEHALRAIERVRTGHTPSEIKSVSAVVKSIENDGNLPESLRVLVPRIASAALFDIRSKRGAAHVKEISPRYIDAALAVQAASWILAEFVRLYHVPDEVAVAAALAALMAGSIPLIEKFGDETVATTPLHPNTEVLLMVSAAEPAGIDRRGLSQRVKQSPAAITRAIQKLVSARHIHKTGSGVFRITGPGEQELVRQLAAVSSASPAPRRRRRKK
jgi:hypothetical protein